MSIFQIREASCTQKWTWNSDNITWSDFETKKHSFLWSLISVQEELIFQMWTMWSTMTFLLSWRPSFIDAEELLELICQVQYTHSWYLKKDPMFLRLKKRLKKSSIWMQKMRAMITYVLALFLMSHYSTSKMSSEFKSKKTHSFCLWKNMPKMQAINLSRADSHGPKRLMIAQRKSSQFQAIFTSKQDTRMLIKCDEKLAHLSLNKHSWSSRTLPTTQMRKRFSSPWNFWKSNKKIWLCMKRKKSSLKKKTISNMIAFKTRRLLLSQTRKAS